MNPPDHYNGRPDSYLFCCHKCTTYHIFVTEQGCIRNLIDWKEHCPEPETCKYCNSVVEHFNASRAKKNSHLKAEEGVEYAFTLTMPPDHKPANPLPEVARKILEFGLTNKPYEKAIEYAYVLEHTDKGTPHIHGVYKTPSGRRISGKYFKRYWPLWDESVHLGHGHKGGYHQKARHSESYSAYLEKEGVVVKSKSQINLSIPSINDAT